MEIRPNKNSGLYWISTCDLCHTSAPISERPEHFSGLMFTTAQVVFIKAKIAFNYSHTIT